MSRNHTSSSTTASTSKKDTNTRLPERMYYPLFIDLSGEKIIVFGGGKVGARRAKYLTEAGADVSVVSKDYSPGFNGIKCSMIRGDARQHLDGIDGCLLVVAATDSPQVNDEICKIAREKNVLVCRADNHRGGDVVFPMTASVKGHTMAYTTLGEDPKLLGRLKKLIENEFERE